MSPRGRIRRHSRHTFTPSSEGHSTPCNFKDRTGTGRNILSGQRVNRRHQHDKQQTTWLTGRVQVRATGRGPALARQQRQQQQQRAAQQQQQQQQQNSNSNNSSKTATATAAAKQQQQPAAVATRIISRRAASGSWQTNHSNSSTYGGAVRVVRWRSGSRNHRGLLYCMVYLVKP